MSYQRCRFPALSPATSSTARRTAVTTAVVTVAAVVGSPPDCLRADTSRCGPSHHDRRRTRQSHAAEPGLPPRGHPRGQRHGPLPGHRRPLRTTSAARLSATAFDDDAGTSVGRCPPRDAGPVPDHRGRRRERPVRGGRVSRGGRPRLSASSRTRSSLSGVPGSRTGPWGASWKGGRLVVRARARDTRGLATPIELLLELGRREAR